MIFSMFESRQKLNQLVIELRSKGTLHKSHYKELQRRYFISLLIYSLPAFIGFLQIFVAIYAFLECSFTAQKMCGFEDVERIFFFFFLIGIVLIFISLKSISQLYHKIFEIVYLMTSGITTSGELLTDGPSFYYANYVRYKYKDADDRKYVIEMRFVAGTITKAYCVGDVVPVIYDPKKPERSICNPYGVHDYYNLRGG